MRLLGVKESERLVKKHGIPAVKQALVSNESKAAEEAKRLGFPVVLKMASPDIVHKTEARAVVVGLSSEKEVKEAGKRLLLAARKRKARVEGLLIQKQVEGREVIVGSKIDSQFGKVLMFGIGGIFVEVLKDVSFRLVPLERKDVKEMIAEIKGFPVLKGVRGEKPVNFKALEDFLLKVSKLAQDPKVKELDINPAFSGFRTLAADVRILV